MAHALQRGRLHGGLALASLKQRLIVPLLQLAAGLSVHTQNDGDVCTLFDGQNGKGFVVKHGDGWRKTATVCS